MSTSNQITVADMQNAALDDTFFKEVTNSRVGGEASGARIDIATNRLSDVSDTLDGRLTKLGYLPPIAYAGAIAFSVSENTKTVERSSVIYAPNPSDLPFTTSGTWGGDDEDKFYIAASVQVPALADETTTGSSLVGYRGQTVEEFLDGIESIATANSLDLTGIDLVRTRSYLGGWAPSLAGPKGGVDYARDGTTGTASTIYTDRDGFFDSNGDGFSISTARFTIEMYGALGDDSTDNILAINAAIDSSPALGREINVPEGVFRHSGAIKMLTNGVHLVGAGERATILKSTSASANDIEIGDGVLIMIDCSVVGITFDSFTTKTSGSTILVQNGHNIQLDRIKINDAFIAINFQGGSSAFLYYLNQFEINNPVSDGIRLGESGGPLAQDIWLSRGIIAGAGGNGITYLNCSGVYASDMDIIACTGNGIATFPAVGDKNKALFFTNVLCDTCDLNGWNFITNGGPVSEVNIVNCWGSTNVAGHGLRIDEGAGTVDGVLIDGSRFTNNDFSGILLTAGNNITISNTHCLANSQVGSGSWDGITIAAGLSDWTVIGGVYGDGGAIAVNNQDYGINVGAGAGDRYSIIGADVTGNVTGGILDGGTGGESYVSQNVGHRTNKSGAAGVLVGTQSITVTHGVAETPTTGDITVTVTGDMSTRGVTNTWIQNLTSTTFDIKTNANVTGSTLFFGWTVDIGGSH